MGATLNARSHASAFEAVFVALVATASVGVALVHAVATLLRAAIPRSVLGEAAQISWATVLVSVSFAVVMTVWCGRKWLPWAGVLLAVVAGSWLASMHRSLSAAAVAVVVVGSLQTLVASRLADRLRSALSGSRRKQPVRTLMWGILGVLLIVQSARLSTYMADASAEWWLTTRDEFWAKHMCMPAYVHAADLHRQGEENIYHVRHYAGLTRDAELTLTVENMAPFAGDPYQYPPQFLLLPYFALQLTNDFLVMRTVWYALQLLAFVLAACALAAWIGGSSGMLAALLIPIVWLSVPVMQSFQFGQFHLAAIVMSVAAMLAFERGRNAVGGALLAGATVAKLFPGALIVFLLAGRRWRALTWVAVFVGVYTLIGLLILGPEPFTAFVTYQVPQLASGGAFDFAQAFPEERETLIALNFSPAALIEKLRELGVPGMSPAAATAVFAVFAGVSLCLWVAAARRTDSRVSRACAWLAILTLGSLLSSAAWGDYVTAGSVWLLTVIAGQLGRSRLRAAILLTCGLLFVLVPGAIPMPYRWPIPLAMILTTAGVLTLVAFNWWVLWQIARGREPGILTVPACR